MDSLKSAQLKTLKVHNENTESTITFSIGNEPIIKISKEGFKYKDEFIEDAGEIYNMFKEFLIMAKIDNTK